jgi:serine/threonine protein kinase
MSFKFEKDIKKYKIGEKLGQGAYGKVYKAIDKSNNSAVALKVLKFDSKQEGVPSFAIREICFLRTLSHPGIVLLKDVLLMNDKIVLVFEYLKSDLRSHIESSKSYNEDCLKRILMQILKSLHYCHSNRVIHRDLKPQNILLDFSNNAKIADFGLSRCFQMPFKPYTRSVQTLWYRAPELLLGCKLYDTSIDLWSVGCIFAEFVTGEPLFSGSNEKDVIFKIFQLRGTPDEASWPDFQSFSDIPENTPNWPSVPLASVFPDLGAGGVDLLSSLLELNPRRRPSASEAMNHVLFI